VERELIERPSGGAEASRQGCPMSQAAKILLGVRGCANVRIIRSLKSTIYFSFANARYVHVAKTISSSILYSLINVGRKKKKSIIYGKFGWHGQNVMGYLGLRNIVVFKEGK
jgi:hypothetical protein